MTNAAAEKILPICSLPSFKYPFSSKDVFTIKIAIAKKVRSITARPIVASQGTVGYNPNNFSALNITVAHIQAHTNMISPHLKTVDKYTSTAVFFFFIVTS